MCGVLYVESKNGADTRGELLARFTQQKHRGTDGFGFVAIKDGKIVAYERAEEENEIRAKLAVVDADSILFHHRIPTSTPNYAGTAHPFKITDPSFQYDYYVIHNGVITNTNVLKDEHMEDFGIAYKSRYLTASGVHFPGQSQFDKVGYNAGKHNDSESIAVELALFLEGKKEAIQTVGGAAIIGLQVVKDTNEIESVFYGRNEGRPLIWEQPSSKKRKKNKPFCFVIKSEGAGNELPSETLYIRDYKTGSEICYKIDIGSFQVASKPSYGYGATYELPSPKNTDFLDVIGELTQSELEAEVSKIELRVENLRAEREEFQNDILGEPDMNLRSEIRREIIRIDTEIKTLDRKVDDIYFFATDGYYIREE